MTGASGKITLLGRVAVAPDGEGSESVFRGGRRAELVFAYLVAEHQRQVTHDELADALWPEGLPDTWEAALRGVLTEVRRFLSEGGLDASASLSTARRGNQLQLPATVAVDLDVARSALATARQRLADGDARTAGDYAAQALSLARLPFLPSHDGEWVDGVRHELATITVRALEIEARAHALSGDFTAAAGASARLVAAEPFNEGAHQLRIKILGQAGDRSGAIKAFEHCRAVLDAELGVEPSDETKAVLRAATASAPAPPAGPAAPDQFHELSVLVVEDHDFQRRTAVMLLRKLGVGTVLEAGGGVEALALLHDSAEPDVIVCDIDMPGMDGVEFIRNVAARELAGAVVIASALDSKVVEAVRSVSEGYGLQVLGAVAKPLTGRGLTDLLAAYRRTPRTSTASSASDHASMTAADIEAALSDGSIAVDLEPGVEVSTGLVTFADAVPRWHRPGATDLPYETLRPAVERAGLLAELFEVVVRQAGRSVVDCAADGSGVELTVELAAGLLDDASLADNAARIVREVGADRALITFALDERALRNAPGPALNVCTRLRVKGFNVAIENFGAGNAPAEQLRRFPCTQARLAPALVAGAGRDRTGADALEATAEVARTLDLLLVGRGCESEDDLQLLLELGCDRVAGPLIAAPRPRAEFAGWLTGWDPTSLGAGARE